MTLTLLSILHVFICILLMIIILLQKGEEGGLGGAFGGGGGDTAFGVKTAGHLKKTTAVVSTVFFVLCIVLGVLGTPSSSITDVDRSSSLVGDDGGPAARPAGTGE